MLFLFYFICLITCFLFFCPSDSEELSPPTDLKLNVLSSTAAILSWRNPMQHLNYGTVGLVFDKDIDIKDNNKDKKSEGKAYVEEPSFSYTVRYGEVSERDGHVANYTYMNPPFFPSLYLVDLVPNTRYEFFVRLNKGDQHSAWSLPVLNTTLEAGTSASLVNKLHVD